MVNEISAGVDAGIMAPDTDVLCSSSTAPGTNGAGGGRRPLQPHRLQAAAPLTLPKWDNPRTEPTLHAVSERCLQLGQRVAPGAQLQQPQRHRDAQGGHDQVGAVLRLGERLVEADGEPGVELRHAVLKAAVAVATLYQPKADDEGRRWQATHVLRRGRVHREAASKNTKTQAWRDETESGSCSEVEGDAEVKRMQLIEINLNIKYKLKDFSMCYSVNNSASTLKYTQFKLS